jgi:hypothetical protein
MPFKSRNYYLRIAYLPEPRKRAFASLFLSDNLCSKQVCHSFNGLVLLICWNLLQTPVSLHRWMVRITWQWIWKHQVLRVWIGCQCGCQLISAAATSSSWKGRHVWNSSYVELSYTMKNPCNLTVQSKSIPVFPLDFVTLKNHTFKKCYLYFLERCETAWSAGTSNFFGWVIDWHLVSSNL